MRTGERATKFYESAELLYIEQEPLPDIYKVDL